MNFIKLRIKKTAVIVKNWIKKHKIESIILLIIISAGIFFRLWRINEYLQFLGDEGRDVRVVRKLLVDFDLVFVGPRTSIGNMYLGPLFYYLIAPALLIANFSPVGPAVFVALLDVTTIGLIWFMNRKWFGKKAGLSAALLYALSPVVINHARHSWNPNIMPFFALLAVYALWSIWQKHSFQWLIVLGVAFAFILQSHYLGTLLLPLIALTWFITGYSLFRSSQSKKKKSFLRYSLISLFIFSLLMLPLVLFDAKHGWRNFEAMKIFFTHRQTTVSAKPWNALPNIWPLWRENIATRLLAGKNKSAGLWTAVILAVSQLYLFFRFLFKSQRRKDKKAYFLILLWIIIGLVGLGVYKQSIFDHYFGFMFPAPFLLTGLTVEVLWKTNGKKAAGAFLGTLSFLNIFHSSLREKPNRLLQRTKKINRKILEEADNKAFNIALLADNNYAEAYLYFFELWQTKVKEIDPQQSQKTITDQLFVICEDPKKPDEPDFCNPINNPKSEIANFGWAKIEEKWQIEGVKLFKLTHAKDKKEN